MTGTVVSVEEYLRTDYSPDAELVCGELIERNAGTQKHGFIQAAIAAFLWQFRRQYGR